MNTLPESMNTLPESMNTLPESMNTLPESMNTLPESMNTLPESMNVNGHPTFPPVGQLKIPPLGVSLLIDGDEGFGSSSLPQGFLFPVVGAVGAVGNGDGLLSAFSKSCGKARPHRGFP